MDCYFVYVHRSYGYLETFCLLHIEGHLHTQRSRLATPYIYFNIYSHIFFLLFSARYLLNNNIALGFMCYHCISKESPFLLFGVVIGFEIFRTR